MKTAGQKGKGNTAAGLQYFEDYVQALDSLTKEKISRTFADLETHYQTNEKEQKIQSLDKENRLRTLELQNASHQRQILILGLAALGVISLLLYFNYRSKEKLNRALNEKNDRLDQMNQHLAEANDTKARLFGIIGHDLRSPVSKKRGNSSLGSVTGTRFARTISPLVVAGKVSYAWS